MPAFHFDYDGASLMSIINGNVGRLADNPYFRVLGPVVMASLLGTIAWAWSDIKASQADLQRQIYSLSSETHESILRATEDSQSRFTNIQTQIGAVQTSVTSLSAAFAVRVDQMLRDNDEVKKRVDRLDDRVDGVRNGSGLLPGVH